VEGAVPLVVDVDPPILPEVRLDVAGLLVQGSGVQAGGVGAAVPALDAQVDYAGAL
jgi:hypothetical protein